MTMKFFDFLKPKKKASPKKEEFLDGIKVTYKKHHFSKNIKISVKNQNEVLVTMPKYATYKEAQNFVYLKEDWIKKAVLKKEAYGVSDIEDIRKRAKKILPERLSELAREHGFSYKKVSIRNQKTRYGSCSYSNNINLNMNLVDMPQKFIDYVILHELCHTVEKNHSKRFWALLQSHMPNALEVRRDLKKVHL